MHWTCVHVHVLVYVHAVMAVLSSAQAVSCAGIGSVEVSEITPYGEYLGHQFKCQTSITYQVKIHINFIAVFSSHYLAAYHMYGHAHKVRSLLPLLYRWPPLPGVLMSS